MVPIIPRKLLFGNPDRAAPRVSPDGHHLAWIAPDEGVLNLWIAPIEDLAAAKPITRDRSRGVRTYAWAHDGVHLLYLQDQGGDENWRLYAVDRQGSAPRDLTPYDNVAAQLLGVLPEQPEVVYVAVNDRHPALHDVLRVRIADGATERVAENPGFAGWVLDAEGRPRVALQMLPDGSTTVLLSEEGAWKPLFSISSDDALTTTPMGFNRAGDTLYLLDSRGRDTSALVAMDLRTGALTVLHVDPRADVSDLLMHPTEHRPQAVAVTYDRKLWTVLDSSLSADFAAIAPEQGEVEIVSRTLDDRLWVVAEVGDRGATRYHLRDRSSGRSRFLFTNRSALDGLPLAAMQPVMIPARDGLTLVGYLTRPEGPGPHPMVLDVHGGPWARDEWGYNAEHQWLANRGYAVLSVNFRGSTGFGKAFINAANHQWGTGMQEDLHDAVAWAVAQGVAIPEKVAIYGGSYGGYATLAGLAFTPEAFACGVDIVGPSNLVTLLETIPAYWEPAIALFTTRVGDHRTEEGRAFLASRSPLGKADQIRRPLLIAQGANDPRVKQSESDQIVAALRGHGIPVSYALFPDEGHGFVRPENSLAFTAIAEQFLAEHLGGRAEPVGEDLAGSSVELRR